MPLGKNYFCQKTQTSLFFLIWQIGRQKKIPKRGTHWLGPGSKIGLNIYIVTYTHTKKAKKVLKTGRFLYIYQDFWWDQLNLIGCPSIKQKKGFPRIVWLTHILPQYFVTYTHYFKKSLGLNNVKYIFPKNIQVQPLGRELSTQPCIFFKNFDLIEF